ncbi:YeeE/YedE family protein [Paraburkholderia rhizosphaerae]|uniref:YeeE/YedE family protein n=1 Tax=Paraburkholderia rhizosphaerae TaxID=480658 RepID=UPI001FBB2D8C|nr:YeeE/YedE family protein [Paraburkholderia rhizosphaerae]
MIKIAASAIVAVGLYLTLAVSGRQSALFLVGALIGIFLYHSAFSFPSAYRLFIDERRGTAIRVHALMLAVGTGLFVPALTAGTIFGTKLNASVAPASLSVFVGAFISGIGMQLSSRCAGGTLYSTGGGGIHMITSLIASVVGSVLGTAHMPYWNSQPSLGPLMLGERFGVVPALAFTWIALGGIVALTYTFEKRRYRIRSLGDSNHFTGYSLRRGPWPVMAAAVALAALNFATLALSGNAWRVTSAFALWGAKFAAAAGVDVAHWPYWTSPDNAAALIAPVSRDVPSVMNGGIMLGAVLAAALAGRYAPVWRAPLRPLLATALGGAMIGYGARLAYGSNVGSYFSGIVSSSLHGWIWLIAAFIGSIVGIYMRPLFKLTNESSDPGSNC